MSDDDLIEEPDRLTDAPHPRETPELIGQGAAEAAFLEAYNSGRLHHGWMITGPRGTGKATLAWQIARFLLAQPSGAPVPAETLALPADHPVLRRTMALAEPGLYLCRRAWDEKAGRLKSQLGVDEVRKLKSFFTLSATDGGWRVAIVDAMDEMTVAAANALLKLLEEPPAHAILLLVCHQPAKLLPTIRSRCRTLRVEPLGPADLTRALGAAGFEVPERDAATLSALAGGATGEAIRLVSGGGVRLYAEVLALMDSAPRIDRAQVLALGQLASGRGAAARYDLTCALILMALARLTRIGAGGEVADLIEGEAALAARLVPGPGAARIWAQAMQDISARVAHARGVNLDPAQVILDMVMQIEKTARQVTAVSV